MPGKASHKSPPPKKGATQRKGGKVKGGKNAKGDIVVSATGYVAGDYMERHQTADPRYEWNEKGKRVERALPDCLSKRDRKVLKKVRKRARCLDYGLNFCGLRFGPSALIGFIPVVGDFADLFLGIFYVIRKARQADIPSQLTRKMIFNHLVSESIGLVPFIGDIFIAWWKANSRNSWLLEGFLIERAMKSLADEIIEDVNEIAEEDEVEGES